MLYGAQFFDTKSRVSDRRNDTQDSRMCFQLGKNMQIHTDSSESYAEVPNEVLSCNLFLHHASAMVFDTVRCTASAKVPRQILSPSSIIFLISCFIALKRDTTLSIRFCDFALFSYMGSNHPVHVHIVRISWAVSQFLPKPIELLSSAGVIHFTFSRASVLKVVLISAVNNERSIRTSCAHP